MIIITIILSASLLLCILFIYIQINELQKSKEDIKKVKHYAHHLPFIERHIRNSKNKESFNHGVNNYRKILLEMQSKGISKYFIKNFITIENYIKCSQFNSKTIK